METKTITTSAGPVHYADFGGEGAPVVLVHGLGGAHTNWMAVGGELARGKPSYRVFAPDLIGFGRTPPAGRAPDLEAQVGLLSTFIKEVAGGPAVVAGNSMGGLVALMTAAAYPERVRRLILVNSALPRPITAPVDPAVATLFTLYMIPLAGELFLTYRGAKLGPEKAMRATLRLCGVDPERVEPEIYAASLALAHERAKMPWANEMFLAAARSIVRRISRRSRVHSDVRRVNAPTMLIQGTEDRLVPFVVGEAIARLRPDWRFEVMNGVGHTPQIQAPELWLDAVTRFLASS